MKRIGIAILLLLVTGALFAEVAESTWKALHNSQVVIVKTDGSEVTGKLTLIEPQSVSVVKANGEVVTVQKKDVRSVRGAAAKQGSMNLGAPSPGWAGTAGILGYISAGAVAAIGIGVIATNGSGDLPTILGGIDLLLAGATFPIVAIGSGSATGVPGFPVLRIVSWIAYGLAMADGIVEVALGASGAYIPDPVIISTVILATTALVCIATDAILTAGQAETAQASAMKSDTGPSVAVLPIFSFVERTGTNTLVPQVGLRCQIRL
ncbi:MAG: hypothetical protein JXD23_14665 [Spirochaetales bacterium]|nr:hypothetical protein [Spirochaetales bacterium]